MDGRAERFTVPRLAGLHLHARHHGDPAHPPLVLLHGAGAHAGWWEEIAPHLAASFHAVALDFRGHGASDRPGAPTLGAFSEDLEALLEHLERRDVVLVGHSLGGRVALAHAMRDAATRALVLLDVARGASPRARRATRLALALARTYPSAEQAIARFRFVPPARRASDALRRSLAAGAVRRMPDGRFGFEVDPRWVDLGVRRIPPGARLACPALLVRGGESTLLTAEGAAAMQADHPGLRLVTVPEAGHHVHLDAPEAVISAIRDFLAL